MANQEPSTQESILLATIDCINENGIENLTTRMIAEKAGANIASINYYFRTKEILVNKALEITINHMLEDVVATLENPELSFREMLYDVIYYLISGAYANPGISNAHLYRLVIEKDYQSVSAQSFLAAFEGLLNQAAASYPDRDHNYLRRILASVLSSIMFMMQTPFFFQLDEEKLPEEEQHHHEMARHFTEMFFAMV